MKTTFTRDQESRLTELESRRDFLNDELQDIEEAIEKLRLEAAPFKIGDTVLARRRSTHRDEEAQITDVQVHSWGAWYRVGWKKKDGTYGKHNERVFDDVKAVV